MGHSAVNFLQFEYGCFAPNNPACMRGSMPKEEDRGHVSMDKILKSLPNQTLSATQVIRLIVKHKNEQVLLYQ